MIEGIQREAHKLRERLMKLAAEMRSGAVMYTESFKKIWFKCLEVNVRRRGGIQMSRQNGDSISLAWFFRIRRAG
jgi:hypothetical protein